jgi:hypothetical protein
VSLDTIANLCKRYLDWIGEEMEKGRTAFVAKDIMKFLDFIQGTAVQREKLGLDEKAYQAILAQGNKSVMEKVDYYKKATNDRTD